MVLAAQLFLGCNGNVTLKKQTAPEPDPGTGPPCHGAPLTDRAGARVGESRRARTAGWVNEDPQRSWGPAKCAVRLGPTC